MIDNRHEDQYMKEYEDYCKRSHCPHGHMFLPMKIPVSSRATGVGENVTVQFAFTPSLQSFPRFGFKIKAVRDVIFKIEILFIIFLFCFLFFLF